MGSREAEKVPGLNRSKNNIGRASVTYTSLLKNGCSTHTVLTDPNSGEYVVYLPPLKYTPDVEVLNNASIFLNEVFDDIDLSGTPTLHTVTDSVFNESGGLDSVETTTYHERLDYIHRVDPIIVVKDPNGVDDFIGDTSYTYIHKVTGDTTHISLRDNSPFQWPIFQQQNEDFEYRCLIKVFEEYQNFDPGYEGLDSVPTTDGTLNFNNEISHLPVVSIGLDEVNKRDSLNFLIYSFKPGNPNFLPNPVPQYSYTKKFKITLVRPVGSPINWEPIPANPAIAGGGDKVYRAYLTGWSVYRRTVCN